MRLNGRTVTYASPEQRVRMGVVSLAGGDGVFPAMTVAQNLEMGAYVHRKDRADVDARVDRVLERFPAARRPAVGEGRRRCRAASSRCWRWRWR